MAGHDAIAAVSRSLQALLADRMEMTATVTLAPPDIDVAGITGARVNLYLVHVSENAALANQTPPGDAPPGAYGTPPLALDLHYLLSTRSATDDQAFADLNAQSLLGEAMRVLHDFGPGLAALRMTRTVGDYREGDPVLDLLLADEPDALRVTLARASIDELTKFWSALGESAFRRSVMYEVGPVRIATPRPRPAPRPVVTRRLSVAVTEAPVLAGAMRFPAPGEPPGDTRVAVGETLLLDVAVPTPGMLVRLGGLPPFAAGAVSDGGVMVAVPDDLLPGEQPGDADRPIAAAERLQPGPLAVEVLVERPLDAVSGRDGRGESATVTRRVRSNALLLELTPLLAALSPGSGGDASVLTLTGRRLWRPGGRTTVIVGNVALAVRSPGTGEAWPGPSPTAVAIPFAEIAPMLAGSGWFAVTLEVDGVRARGPALQFEHTP